MATTIKHSGGQVEIKPRRMRMPFTQLKAQKFYKDNAVLSAFLSALSGTFPPGEAEFIASVRQYLDKIDDPELLENVKNFISQEGHHSHQHKDLNKTLNDLGWDALYVEESLKRAIVKRNKFKRFGSDKFRLALTTGIEHLTAIMAEYMMTTPDAFEDADPIMVELLTWHAVEELEHKAVAFDVFMKYENDQAYLRKVLNFGLKMFTFRVSLYTIQLLWKARIMPSWREIKEAYNFMYDKETGLITKLKPLYRDYFKEGFHPWDHQNAHLIDEWKAKYYNPEHDKSAG